MSISSLNILKNGSKIFSNGKVVFKNFDFSLTKGITFIMGPNGCGKTTLLRVILGLEELSKGEKLYHTTLEDKRSAVLQDYNSQLLLSCSLKKNIETVFNKSNNDVSKIEDSIISDIKKWGYDLELDQIIGTLSGGQKQAFTLARAFNNNPEVLILDEPVSAIDFKRKLEILRSIKNFSKSIYTIVSSHDINDAILIADRIVVFDENLQLIVNKILPPMNPNSKLEDRLVSPWADELRKEIVSRNYMSN